MRAAPRGGCAAGFSLQRDTTEGRSYETGKRGNSRKECLQNDFQRQPRRAGSCIQRRLRTHPRASYTIRGFKKGEADRAQIEADRGEHTFWYDAINDLMDKDVPALYDAAMAEHGFVAVDNPVYDLVSVKKDEGFVATATVALQPELNLTKTTGFTAECVHPPEVTDKEIDNVLERRRAAAAELVPHKGPAVKGNIVHIDYEGLLEDKPFQGGTAKNQAVSWAAAA